jgi:hypothetical protein
MGTRCQWSIAFLTSVFALAQPSGPSFRDIAPSIGLTESNVYGHVARKQVILETTGTGAAVFDADSDGDNDLLLLNGAPALDRPAPPPSLYLNDGKGQFSPVAKSGLVPGWSQAACAADFDNDGSADLFLTYYGVHGGAGCTWVDYDRDGFVDLFVSRYVDLDMAKAPKPGSRAECIWKDIPVMCGPRGLPMALNSLYRNLGDGTFADVTVTSGIRKPGGRYGLGAVAADFNNDGWPDIYVACDQTPSLLYQNTGKGTFIERGAESGVAYNFDGRLQAGMGVAVADFDGNGQLDIAKTNFSGDLPSLYANDDGSFFNDISQQAGLGAHRLLGWGAAFLDVDEDGWKDLVIANGHVYPEVDSAKVGDEYRQLTILYRNLGNGRFADITASAGPAFSVKRPSRGLATGDLDGDGRPEIVIVNMNEPPSVLKNSGPRGHWLRIECEGVKSNRSAIGARVTVDAAGRKQTDEVRSGSSYYSQSETALYFGLGPSEEPATVEVRWPNGLREVWTGLAADRSHRLKEGSGAATRR